MHKNSLQNNCNLTALYNIIITYLFNYKSVNFLHVDVRYIMNRTHYNVVRKIIQQGLSC